MPKLFGAATVVLAGACVLMVLVMGFQEGFWAFIGVAIALFLFLQILNAYETNDIEQRKQNTGGRRDRN